MATNGAFVVTNMDEKTGGEQQQQQEQNNNTQPLFAVTSLDFKIAARLVIDGKELRNITFKQTENDLKSYEFYLSKWMVLLVNLTFITHLLVLPIFEEPAYTIIPYWIPCAVELLCLCVYTARILHSKAVQSSQDFYGDKKNLVIIGIICLTIIDVVAFLVIKALKIEFVHRYTRMLRVLFYINFNEARELRRAFRNVRRTLPDVLNVFVLFLASLIVFSFLGWTTFRKKNFFYTNGLPYFQYFEDSLWDMYVSVTTANFPDVMMPAYSNNGAYAIFFIVFMLINLYIFINIILAVIYSNYKKHLKNEVKETILLRRSKLENAFNLLKLSASNNQERQELSGTIIFNTFYSLMKLIDPQKSNYQIKILFNLLDLDGDNALSLKEFLYLADLLNVRITEVKDRQTLFERFLPNIFNSRASVILRSIVRHRFFSIPFDVLILLNVILLIFEINEAEWFFLTVFLIEILLRLYTLGAREFFKRYWNIFDTVIILAGFIVGIIEATIRTETSTEILEIVLILRLLRLLKLLSSIQRLRVVITTIMNITPSLLTYASLILTIYYIFAMLGMELFGGRIKSDDRNGSFRDCRNPKLQNTEFAKLNYCKNNFDNFLNSLVLMFELMVVNQWHVLTQGFVAVTSKWARLFFFGFHLTCVIVSLNIFTAFVLEAFLLEYEANEKTLFETRIEDRIIELGLNLEDQSSGKTSVNASTPAAASAASAGGGNRILNTINEVYGSETEVDISKIEGVKFHLNPKGPKPVDILLQRMFSQEFDITQDDILNN